MASFRPFGTPAPTLSERLQHNMLADQMRRAVNTIKAVLHAEAAALEEDDVDDFVFNDWPRDNSLEPLRDQRK